MVGGTRPKYSQFSEFGFGTEVGPDEFAEFCTDVATRYGTSGGPFGKVCTDYEIWSDPNNGGSWGDVVNAASYVSYLQPAYTAIKSVSGLSGTGSRIIFGGTQHVTAVDSSWLTQSETDFLTAAYTAGAHGYFDVMAIHPFTDIDALTAPTNSSPALLANDAIHALMVSNGDGALPIWWTAFGYSTSDFTQANQATYISTMFTLAASRTYVQRLFVQALLDTSSDPQNRTGNYGVIAIDWTLKPAYGYLQALNPYYRTGVLAGAGGFSGAGIEQIIGGTLNGAGGFLGAGAAILHASGSLIGAGGFSGAAVTRYAAAGALTGHGSFSGFEASSGRAGTILGVGGFTATGRARYIAAGTVAGSGNFSGTALVRRTAGGVMAGSGHFASTVTSRTSTSATITGHGGFTGTGRAINQPTVAASLNSGTFSSSRSPTTGTIAGYTPALNDLVVIVLALTQSGAITVAAPSGWTAITFGANNFIQGTSSGTAGSMVILYHYVTSAEVTAGTTSWTLTNVLGTAKAGRRYVAVLRGVNTTTPVDAVASAATTGATMTIPDVTPGVRGGLVLGFGMGNTNSASETIAAPTSPWSTTVGQMSGTSQVGFIAQNSTFTTSGVLVAGQSLAINRTDDLINAAATFVPA